MNQLLPAVSAFSDPHALETLTRAIADPGYGVFPDFLSAETVADLTALIMEKIAADELERAGVGKGEAAKVRSEIRSDSIFWLEPGDPSPVTGAWLASMDGLCAHLRASLFLPVESYEGHLARYPANGFYKPHLDQHQQSLARQITIITYLNGDWSEDDGGLLRLYTDPVTGTSGGHIDVLPRAGTVVVFRSADFWHEVLASRRDRLSLTGWLRTREGLPGL